MHIAFTPQQVASLRRFVRVWLGIGILTSVGANILHSVVQTEASTFVWWRLAAALFWAALAPAALFACVEMIFRIPAVGKALRILNWVRLGVTVPIGGFAAWVSYWAMVDITVMLGQDKGYNEHIYPLIVDGMMAVATISLIALDAIGRIVNATEAEKAEAAAAAEAAEAERAAKAAAAKEAEEVSEEEERARKAAGYYTRMDGKARGQFTRKWRKQRDERVAREAKAAAKAAAQTKVPQSPDPATGMGGPVDAYVYGEDMPVSPAHAVRVQ